jgi:hypothetical protein
MRWRIAIAVLAVLGIAGAVYVGMQPKSGTVEYHKKQFRKIYNDGRASRIGELILRFGPDRLKHAYLQKIGSRLDFHRNALVEHGYLARRTFVLSFLSPQQAGTDVINSMLSMTQTDKDKCRYGTVEGGATNSIVVIDTPERMERWIGFVQANDMAWKE